MTFRIIKSKLDDILELRKNLGICQHHDAISGTAKEHVSQDYVNRTYNSIEKVQEILVSTLKYLLAIPYTTDITSCITPVTNKTCENLVYNVTDNNKMILIFNNGRN